MDDSQETLTKADDWADTASLMIFEAGDLVGGRYRILRFIARGGVAEVYEAEDEALRQRVALKALRRDPANLRAIERFKREINLARQVTHPNVCRIYEFGSHGESVLFLTMELLEGETLLERIERDGPMTTAEALPLVRQMAAGLNAAHRAGVIHRDFKCGNVMLVPSADAPGELRVAINDFGLAREVIVDDLGPRVTAQDALVGTPAYMAPEQVEGGAITPAADIYAFGVVLYEMVTGRYPFRGESSLATAVMRLKEPPSPPSVYLGDFDEKWDRVILRCLERCPEDRFQSTTEIVTALEQTAPVLPRQADESVDTDPPAVGRPARWWLAAAIVFGAVSASLLGIFFDSERETPQLDGMASAVPRRSIALLDFKNLSGESTSDWLSPALTEMLSMEAAAGEDLRVIPGDNVAQTKIELGFNDLETLSSNVLVRAGEILDADLIVVGNYLVAGRGSDRDIRLDLRILEASKGRTIESVSVRGTEAKVLDLVDEAGRALRDALGLAGLSQAEVDAVRASRPAGPEAAKLYAQGLEELRLYNAKEALDLLKKAAESDEANPLIRIALSSAWAELGYHPRALEEARRAVELSGGLSRRDKLWVEAHFHEIAGDRPKALENYLLLWDFYPDNLEYGLRLANAQSSVLGGNTSLETLSRLRDRSTAMSMDARIDLEEAEASRHLARYRTQQIRAAEAARKGESLGARLLVARAREVEASALRDLGETEAAMVAYEEARAIYRDARNRGAAAAILIDMARIHRYQGRFAEAQNLAEEAQEVAREIGDTGSIRNALNLFGIILREEGKLSEALAKHEFELEASRESGDPLDIHLSLTSLGVVELELGDLGAARRSFEEALTLSRDMNHLRALEINTNMVGETLLRAGRLAQAEESFKEALEYNRQTGSPRGRAFYLTNLGEIDLLQGRLEEARKKHREALEIRESMGERPNIAFSHLALGRVALAEGREPSAVALAQQAADEFRTERKVDAEGYALAYLAAARLAQGRTAQAEAAISRASEILEASENRRFQLVGALFSARVDAAAGRETAARKKAGAARDQATELGFVHLRLEAELLIGELESRTDPQAAASRLRALAAEAVERGYVLLARKASEALDLDEPNRE